MKSKLKTIKDFLTKAKRRVFENMKMSIRSPLRHNYTRGGRGNSLGWKRENEQENTHHKAGHINREGLKQKKRASFGSQNSRESDQRDADNERGGAPEET